MNEAQIISELERTRSLCDRVDTLFGGASRQGRMLSSDEALCADELSHELLRQIRKLPQKLCPEQAPVQLRKQAGDTLQQLQTTLRRIASPAVPAGTLRSSKKRIVAYTV